MRPLVLGSPCVCPKQILFLLSKKCLTCRVVFRPSLVLCGQPPSCQGSRVVCHVQPRTPDPGTVTRKRDTDCDSFASFVSPSHLPIVRVCGVFYFISDFSHVSFLAPCEGPMQAPVPHISIRVSSEASRSTKPRRRASGPNILRPALPGPPPRLKKGTLAIPLLICFASHSTQSLYYKRVYFPVTSVNSYLFDMGLVRLLQNFLELLIQCYLVLAAALLSPASCLPAFSLLFRVVQ